MTRTPSDGWPRRSGGRPATGGRRREAVTEAGSLACADSGATEAGVAPAPGAALGLTPRESDVLQQLAQGGSNREIGEALFISPRTVNFHVTNLLSKLDLDFRAAAAALPSVMGLHDSSPAARPGRPDRLTVSGQSPQSGSSDGAPPAPLWHREGR